MNRHWSFLLILWSLSCASAADLPAPKLVDSDQQVREVLIDRGYRELQHQLDVIVLQLRTTNQNLVNKRNERVGRWLTMSNCPPGYSIQCSRDGTLWRGLSKDYLSMAFVDRRRAIAWTWANFDEPRNINVVQIDESSITTEDMLRWGLLEDWNTCN